MVDGASGLRAALNATAIGDADIDLVPHVQAFHAHTIGLHLKRRGRPISAHHRNEMVSAIRRFVDWAATDGANARVVTTRRSLSLLAPTLFQRYTAVLEARTKSHAKAAGKAVKNSTGHRPMRDCTLALRQFVRYLQTERGVPYAVDPTDGKAPPANTPPRMQWLPLDDVRKPIATLPDPASVYCAILHATALDTSDVARLTADCFERRDDQWMVSASSKKTRTRRRRVPVHRWAIPEIEPYLLQRIGAAGSRAQLFPDRARWRNARDPYARLHAAAVMSLVDNGQTRFAGYEPRDSRHSVAVQMCQAGIPIQLVAQQLGSAVDTVASTYGPVDHDGGAVGCDAGAARRSAPASLTDVAGGVPVTIHPARNIPRRNIKQRPIDCAEPSPSHMRRDFARDDPASSARSARVPSRPTRLFRRRGVLCGRHARHTDDRASPCRSSRRCDSAREAVP